MKRIYFFIGTEAELMKMFRVIQEAQKRGYDCRIVSNGQNDIHNSHFLQLVGGKIHVDLTAYGEKEKNASGYSGWFMKTEKLGCKIMKKEVEGQERADVLMVVHGDTLSTLMGARIATKCKINYVHVESGARSFNCLSPFPEEIDRYFSSVKSKINFCPKKEYAEYAAKAFRGKAVNTLYNTGIETLYYALEENEKNKLERPINEPYFLLAIHRQENLMNKKFLRKVVSEVLVLSEKMKCLFIYHEQTKNALEKCGVWRQFESCENIKIIPRQNYFAFINCVECSEFIIADGCGNQQEMYYLGKPYLIMRTKVERDSEGLGWNAKYFENDFNNISRFAEEYRNYKRGRVIMEKRPSEIIIEHIDEYFQEE